MIGQHMGRSESEEAKGTLVYITKLTAICLLIISALTYPFANLIAGLYSSDAEVVRIAAMLIRTASLSMPTLWAMSFILPAGLKGAGDAKYTMVISIASMWVFRVGFGYILCIHAGLGVLGVWLGMYIDWVFRGIMFYLRLKSGKWKNNVVIKVN